MSTTLTKGFAIGDRVELINVGHAYSCVNGVVVWYRRCEHDPRDPRVRWASGWGTSIAAHELRHQTEEEKKRPVPKLVECDINPTFM